MYILFFIMVGLLTHHWSGAECALIFVTVYLLWREEVMRDELRTLQKKVADLETKNQN